MNSHSSEALRMCFIFGWSPRTAQWIWFITYSRTSLRSISFLLVFSQ